MDSKLRQVVCKHHGGLAAEDDAALERLFAALPAEAQVLYRQEAGAAVKAKELTPATAKVQP